MLIFRSLLIFLLLVSFQTQLNASDPKNKAFRTYWNPTYLGERLDYCTLDGRFCGKEVANQYCKILGYESSSASKIAYNVGLTNFLASRAQCKGWRCNGFMMISCAIRLSHTPSSPYHYREKRYANPRYNQFRVSWCYDRNKGCGRKAANYYCNRMGYIKAKTFEKETHVSATKTIGSQHLCFGSDCVGFKSIICFR